MASNQINQKSPDGLDALKNLQSNKYSISEYVYPSDLGQREDLQHYVAFFVNVRQKSKLSTDKVNDSVPVINEIYNAGDNLSVEKLVAAGGGKAAAVAAAAGIAGLASAYLEGDPKKAFNKAGQLRKALKVGVAGAGIAAGALLGASALSKLNGNLFEPDKKLRLQDVITLHIEERPSTRYGVQYQTADLGSLLGLLANTNDLSATNLSSLAGEAATLGLYNLARIPGLVAGGSGPKLADAVGAFARIKTNPFREVLFEAVDHRKFTFRHRFFPKNLVESNNVRNIIRMFKEHMHPTLSKNNLFYIYPSEFEIKYFFGYRENPYLFKISRCALSDMAVDYGGETFSTFDNGAPTEIGMTLTFQELDLHTRSSIRMGY